MGFGSFIQNMFMTPSQKKEKDDAYYNKMMPFKDKQQKWEDSILNAAYEKKKNIIPTIKYLSYLRREMYIDGTANVDEAAEKIYRKQLKRMKISGEDEEFIDRFSRLEYEAKSLDDLPSLDKFIK